MLTTKPRGTNDILPADMKKWHMLESTLRQAARQYGFSELRTPIFEHTELFQRGVGETTDIVEKEMYTFTDRGGRSLTLRPEGTAPAVRSFVENKMYADPQPTKLFYLGPMFRYDRPQAGRFRQFHQFGVEVFGSQDPGLDAEVIAMAMDIYGRLGLQGLKVELNSVGCPRCRPVHRERLQQYLADRKDQLCPTCQGRYEKNPLRILDCKSSECQSLTAGAPTITELLCEECRDHFERVQEYLQALGIDYHIEPGLVRGLDYYTRTAFEIVACGIGAQSSIGGGGRYDGLSEQCGGPPVPGIGYAMGLERILLTMEQQGIVLPDSEPVQVFVAALGEKAQLQAAIFVQQLRRQGLAAERDYLGRSLKAQLKSADRLGVRYTVIIGDDELQKQEITVRDMSSGSQTTVPIAKLESYLTEELGRSSNE